MGRRFSLFWGRFGPKRARERSTSPEGINADSGIVQGCRFVGEVSQKTMKHPVHALGPGKLELFLERRRRGLDDGLASEAGLAENLVEVLNRAKRFRTFRSRLDPAR